MNKFEKVSRFKDVDLDMPIRKTEYSAGYDMVAAEDTVVPSYLSIVHSLRDATFSQEDPLTLTEVGNITKTHKLKPTLVSTGMKCQLDNYSYLELSIRSSSPLKYWLVLANGVGIIDSDYYNNPDNEGEIFFQLINLSPYDILIKKGEAIGQGIIHHYDTTDDDMPLGSRVGGFGSTNG